MRHYTEQDVLIIRHCTELAQLDIYMSIRATRVLASTMRIRALRSRATVGIMR